MSLADNTTPAEEDLLRTLLSDPGFPLGLRPLPAGSGEPQSSVKSEEVAAVAPSVDWLGLAGATFGAHSTIPLLSSNPLTYGQSQAVLQQEYDSPHEVYGSPAEGQHSSSIPGAHQFWDDRGQQSGFEPAIDGQVAALPGTRLEISIPEHPGRIDSNDARDRARAAQKRFRTRQKERTRSQQKQLEELSSRMKELMQDNAALQTRNKILEGVVKLNTRHEKRLHCNQEIMAREQGMLMEELAHFVNVVEGRSELTGQDVQEWTMGQYMDHVFEWYIRRCKKLLAEGTESALEEIDNLVIMRGEMEDRKALFSCYYWALYCWNKEEMQTTHRSPPPASLWFTILEGLQLSQEQGSKLLAARQDLLDRLHTVAAERRTILSNVALLVLQRRPEEWQSSPEMQQLQSNLGQERKAVHTFLYSVCDETLTPQQEAYLDTAVHPWWPDMWHITGILDQQSASSNGHGGSRQGMSRRGSKASLSSSPVDHAALDQRAQDVPNLAINIPVLKGMSLLPHSTAMELLTQPLLAKGAGLRLKWAAACFALQLLVASQRHLQHDQAIGGLVIDPFQTVLPAAAFAVPAIAQLRGMHILDVHCGRFFPVMFWDWMKEHLPHPPELPH